MTRSLLRVVLLLVPLSATASAQLEVVFTFNPSQTGQTCGLAAVPDVWAYECFGGDLDRYDTSGNFIASIPRPGGSANDVDIDLVTAPMTLGGSAVPAGSLLYFDGEMGVCEIYAIDPASGAVLASLVTAFGVGHVVGGAYCPVSDTVYLVQDRVPGAAAGNQVVQIDPASGMVLSNFHTVSSGVTVNFGDLDISTVSGNIYIVSSDESSIAEFTPTGALVAQYALPSGVGGLSGIATDDLTGGVWVCNNTGTVWFLSGLVQVGVPYCSPSVTNSSGGPALARAFGSNLRSTNTLRLVAFQLPSNSFGYFLTSQTQGFVMNPGGSQGHICLGGSVGRYNAANQIFNSANVGRASLDLDLGMTPSPSLGLISIQAGETWNFQAWYRDANPNVTSNFTDGVSVMFL